MIFVTDIFLGLTDGIKIDDSPRKDNSANSTLDEDRRKSNGSVVTQFSAKKGFTLSHENLVEAGAAAAAQNTEFSGLKPAAHLDVRPGGGHHERSSSNIEKSDTFNASGLRPKSRNSSVVEPPVHEHLAVSHHHSGSSIKSKMGQLQSNLSLLNLNLSGGGILSKKKSLGSRSSHSSSETSR